MEGSAKSRPQGDPYDLDGQNFNPDKFYQKLLKEDSLSEIMDKEERIVQETQKLYSEMQTLVYENYNKFIYATDTIKKMKSDFKKMENEMDLLAKNMESITSFSDQISSTLHDTRQQISKLSSVHSLLKSLQFLFKLPNKLKTLMQEGNYAQAVQDYLQTQQVLNQNAHLESFQGIQSDCIQIVGELKDKLRGQLKSKDATAKDLAQSVELLLLLGEPAESLYMEFLRHASKRLADQIEILSSENSGQDMIDFVDMINNGFLSDLCLVLTSYNELFVDPVNQGECSDEAVVKLNEFVEEKVFNLLKCVETRVERETCDCEVMVRALDRFQSRINALSSIFKHSDFSRQGISLIVRTGVRQCELQERQLEEQLGEQVRRVRESVASQEDTEQLYSTLKQTTIEKMKAAVHELTVFVRPDLSFAGNRTYLETFSVKSVRSNLVMGFFNYLVELAESFTKANTTPSLPTLLILAKVCLEFEATHVNEILELVDHLYTLPENKEFAKEKQVMCERLHKAAQKLVNHYVRMEGNIISQMLRKSVEARDWVHSLEPRTVRAVMKRVLEEAASVEARVGSLFREEGGRHDPGSDSSSRRTPLSRHARSAWSASAPATPHLHKLFLDRIEIYAPVQFTKVSILTGIIKISLKTLLECVRLRTFSKFGLQQIQVDTHYLLLHLYNYVPDENLVHRMLDEILNSAVHRCMNPVLMEPSVVESICERG